MRRGKGRKGGAGQEDGATVEDLHGGPLRVAWATARHVTVVGSTGDFLSARYDRSLRPVVGDRVRLGRLADKLVLTAIEPRARTLVRRSSHGQIEQVLAANLDLLAIVAAVGGQWSPGLVDRLLVAAAVADVPPLIIMNKHDLDTADMESDADIAVFAALGVAIQFTSAVTGEGLAELRRRFAGRAVALAGHSGVGKSSLLNALVPDADRETGALSARKGTGRHVTSSAHGFPFDEGGLLIDMPGVRLFGMVALEPVELATGFVEIRPHAARCRFPNCTHSHEPDCAVRDAVARGEVTARRYASYLRLLEECAGAGG